MAVGNSMVCHASPLLSKAIAIAVAIAIPVAIAITEQIFRKFLFFFVFFKKPSFCGKNQIAA